jgi:hypothetical protein
LFTKLSSMKNLSFILLSVIIFASCKRKDESLNSDKNIVILTDTTRATGNYLSDTGTARMPLVLAPAPVAPVRTVPVARTPRRSTGRSTSGGSNGSYGNTSSTGSSSAGTTAAAPRKKGWSKAAKGATIGGVGGAVAGAVIGKGAKGAVIGGVIGAAGGYIIGRGKDRKDGRVR